MDWIKEVKEAMLKLQKACMHINWTECPECPFYKYCPMSGEEPLTPDIWEVD